jgi:hypothetical protein
MLSEELPGNFLEQLEQGWSVHGVKCAYHCSNLVFWVAMASRALSMKGECF